MSELGRNSINAPDAQPFVQLAGGCAKVARAVDIRRSAVSNWRVIPANRVLVLEKLIDKAGGDKDRYDMRPDVYGARPTDS